MALTPKQEKAAIEYATGVDADGKPIDKSEAYRRAYNTKSMSDKTLNNKAYELFENGEIKARVAEIQAKVEEKCVVDAAYVRNRLYEIDQMDVLDIHNDDGSIKPIREWPKIWRQYLSAIEVSEVMQNSGDDGQVVAVLKKVKWPDKVRNLELLGKLTSVGAFSEKVDHTSSDGSMTPAKSFTADEYVRAQAKLQGELKGLD